MEFASLLTKNELELKKSNGEKKLNLNKFWKLFLKKWEKNHRDLYKSLN